METRPFNDIVNRISPSVPGCPYPIIEQYVRDAAIEVCERTLAWRFVQPKVRLTQGVYDYPYEVPCESEVHAVLTASCNGSPLQAVSLETLVARIPQWPDMTVDERSTPTMVSQYDSDDFVVAPIPDGAVPYDVRMTLALKPLRDAEGMPKTVLDELENVIMHGALQHLLVMPDKTWMDRDLAGYHAKQFVFRVAERRARANLGNGRATMRVKMQPFA